MKSNWKEWFYFDLGRLLPGTGSRGSRERTLGDLWFVRIFAWIFGASLRTPRAGRAALRDKEYRTGSYYRHIGPRWAGPVYLRNTAWRQDLVHVMQELSAIAKTNASLLHGLEAVAREENVQSSHGVYFYQMLAGASLAISCIMGFGLWAGYELILDHFIPWGALYFVALSVVAAVPGMYLLFRRRRLEAVFLRLRDDLAAGRTLSEGMRRQRRFFPQFYADLVQAGEQSGAFAECIEQLSEDTIQTITAGRVVRDNLIYLGMVGSIQITLTIFLCIKILPIFKDILSDFGGKMIWPARMLMSLDLFFYGHGRGHSGFSWYGALFSEQASLPVALIAVVVVLVLTMAAIAVARRRRRRSYAACSISALFLWIPGLRRLVAKRNLAVIGLILEKLLRAGVPMDRALDSAGSAELNPAHARLVRRVRDRLLQGDGFGDAWKAESPARLVPPSFPALVALGERAGMLPEALGRLAELYQTDVNKWARICSDAVLPFGVLALGGFTFMVEISVYVSIMGISDTILGAL